jgi:nicotinamidase-related amidase
MGVLPRPAFFDTKAAERVYRVPYAERAAEARAFAREHRIAPAREDSRRTGLLLIDVQNTFCLPEFELFVGGRSGRGAMDDNARLASFLYANLHEITEVVATLDTHSSLQIFHPQFWVDAAGAHPAPFTLIRPEDVAEGRWQVNPDLAASVLPDPGVDLVAFSRHYVERLTRRGKYPLTIWPYHAVLGGIGHALVSTIEEAVFFHGIARETAARIEVKGRHPLTENYSVLRPEVGEDQAGKVLVPENRALVDHLLGFDRLIVAGQAQSHCVAWTVEDLLEEITARDPALARKVHLLVDATSPVVVPGVVDYTDAANAAYARFASAGMHLVRTTDAAG